MSVSGDWQRRKRDGMIVVGQAGSGTGPGGENMASTYLSREQGVSMPRRAVESVLSLVAAALAAWLARESEALRGLELWMAAIAAGLTFLIINLGRAIGVNNARYAVAPSHPGLGPARASATVSIVPLSSVQKVANFRDRRFQRFEGRGELPEIEPPALLVPARIVRCQPAGLRGNWVLVSLFVGCDGRPWSESEVAGRLDSLLHAGRWVAKEADRYRMPLALGVCNTYFAVEDDSTDRIEIGFAPEGNDMGPAETDQATRALILMSRGARRLGFRDATDMVEKIAARLPGSRCAWFLHIRRGGRSLAIPHDLTELQGLCLAVCYAREASFTEPVVKLPGPDPVTFVHELLHLFGAADKYGVPLSAFPPGAVTVSDVMRLDRTRLAKLRVDSLTAAEIGWLSR